MPRSLTLHTKSISAISFCRQRRQQESGALKAERVDALEELAFDGDPLETEWAAPRLHLHKGDLGPAREAALQAMGFGWDPTEPEWQRMFTHLKEYQELAGDCLKVLEDTGFVWMVRLSQRGGGAEKQWRLPLPRLTLPRAYKAQHGGCLREGFVWDPEEDDRQARFEELCGSGPGEERPLPREQA
eukprot:jgi/Tetstr1/458522/TSEL_044927.t1